MKNRKRFKWTDELAAEFAKIMRNGSYGDYKDCKTLNEKLKRFKELNSK